MQPAFYRRTQAAYGRMQAAYDRMESPCRLHASL